MLTFHLAWLEALDAGRYGADAQLEYVNPVMVAGQVCLAVLHLVQTGAGRGGPESPPRHLQQGGRSSQHAPSPLPGHRPRLSKSQPPF